MMNLSDNPASLNRVLPPDRLFTSETIEEYCITDTKWLMSVKPGIRNVQKYVNDRIRFEEIEVFSVTVQDLPDTGFTTRLLKQIHSKIVYPCVVLLCYQDKYKISAWNFVDSMRGQNHNIMLSHYTSSWVHESFCSSNVLLCANAIQDLLLNGEGSIKEIYDSICQYILKCSPKYIGSKTHLQKVLLDLTGDRNYPAMNRVAVSKRYVVKNPGARYTKKEYSSAYKYVYEYEDIWYAFMCDEKLRTIIEKRRYRDTEDMIFTIDSKYEEQDF